LWLKIEEYGGQDRGWRRIHMSARSFWLAALLAGAVVLSALVPTPSIADSADSASSTPAAASSSESTDQSYQLGPGDKVRLNVFGEADLSGDFDIDGSGYIRLPLIGQIKASGLTIRGFEEKFVEALKDGYVKDPRVSIEVINYRPFYIIGEVNKPGQYSYVDGMNALNAVALAGGYTPKADKSEVYIQRNGKEEAEFPSNERTNIRPGDVVRIPERFF
jgi:polysaccharide export outer membrane protein